MAYSYFTVADSELLKNKVRYSIATANTTSISKEIDKGCLQKIVITTSSNRATPVCIIRISIHLSFVE